MVAAFQVLVERIRAWPAWAQDLSLAVAVAFADVVLVLSGSGTVVRGVDVDRAAAWVAAGLVLFGTGPLVWRRRWPVGVLIVTGVAATLAAPLGVPLQGLGTILALYSVAAYRPAADSFSAAATMVAFIVGVAATTGTFVYLAGNLLIVLGAFALGRIVRAYRQQAAQLELRAAQLEHEREERTRLAVRGERTRIAREMHDVLAHSLSVVVVQATGARRLLDRNPEQAAEALATIEDTGRRSLAEVRRVVGMLRDDQPDDGLELLPQPTLDDLADLVAAHAAAGMPVELRTSGLPCEVDDSTALSAYRIVQEALTNVVKHADPTRVVVDVRALGSRLEVDVLNDGPDAASPFVAGYGLAGMRERAALVGGRLEAGPRAGGGFRVAAVLPRPVADQPHRPVPAELSG